MALREIWLWKRRQDRNGTAGTPGHVRIRRKFLLEIRFENAWNSHECGPGATEPVFRRSHDFSATWIMPVPVRPTRTCPWNTRVPVSSSSRRVFPVWTRLDYAWIYETVFYRNFSRPPADWNYKARFDAKDRSCYACSATGQGTRYGVRNSRKSGSIDSGEAGMSRNF